MNTATRVPAALKDQFDTLKLATDAFCDQCLNDEYKQLIGQALAALCRKRPSPLLRGQANSWAAGAVHALGTVNCLFDALQTPHCKAIDIWAFFGLTASTGHSHSRKIRDALGMSQMQPQWTLPSLMDNKPLIGMLQIKGCMADARHLPPDAHDIAFLKGLIR